MTTPAPAPAQVPVAPEADAGAVLAIAGTLLSAVSVDAAMQTIVPQLSLFKDEYFLSAFRIPLSIVMAQPPEKIGAAGPATLATSRQNWLRTAQFVLSASRRVAAGLKNGENVRDLATRERRYYGQHLQAIWNRATAASQVDSAATTYGPVLGWYTVHDRHTSAECRKAGGWNFSAEAMPLIGWPGAVHPHCRCSPGPAHRGARMLPSAGIPARMAVKVA